MHTKNQELHEKQARATALGIALRQTDSQAIAHLEAVVGAILATMGGAARDKVAGELAAIEQLPPEALADVQLHGEVQPGVKPKRQAWRDELAALTADLEIERGSTHG